MQDLVFLCQKRYLTRHLFKKWYTDPKLIDEEIKKYKSATLREKQLLLSGQLSKIPDPVVKPSESFPHTNQPLADSNCILLQELVKDEAMLVKCSLQSPPDNIAKLSLPGESCVELCCARHH